MKCSSRSQSLKASPPVPFDVFRADTQQADTRTGVTEDFPGIDAPHDGKLKQMMGATLDVCTGVHQHKLVFRGGDYGRDAGTFHRFELPKPHCCDSDHPARVARGNHRFSASVCYTRKFPRDRAVFCSATSGLSSIVSNSTRVHSLESRPPGDRQGRLDRA